MYNQQYIADGQNPSTLLAVYDGSYKPKLSPNGIIPKFLIEDPVNGIPTSDTVVTFGISLNPYIEESYGYICCAPSY